MNGQFLEKPKAKKHKPEFSGFFPNDPASRLARFFMNPYSSYGYATDPISRFPVNFPARQVVPGLASASDMALPSQCVARYITPSPSAIPASPAPVVGNAPRNGGLLSSASTLPTAHAAPSPAVMPPGSKDEPPENAWLKTAMAAGIGLTSIGGGLMAHRLWKQRKASAAAPPTPPTSDPATEQKKAPPSPIPASAPKAVPGPKATTPKPSLSASAPKAAPSPEPVTPKAPQPAPSEKNTPKDSMEFAMEERARKLKSRMEKLNQEQRAVVKKHLHQLPKEHQIAWMSHISQLSQEQWAERLAHMAEQQAESRLKRWGGKALSVGLDSFVSGGLLRDAAQGGEWLTEKGVGCLRANPWTSWAIKQLPSSVLNRAKTLPDSAQVVFQRLKSDSWSDWRKWHLPSFALMSLLPQSAQDAIRSHGGFTFLISQNKNHFFRNFPLSTAASHGLALLMNEEGPLQKGLDHIGLKSDRHRKVLRPIQWGLEKGSQFIRNYVASHGALKMLCASAAAGSLMGLSAPSLLAGALTLGWNHIPEKINIPEKIKGLTLPISSIPIKDIFSTYGTYAYFGPTPGSFISGLAHFPRLDILLTGVAAYGKKTLNQFLNGLRR